MTQLPGDAGGEIDHRSVGVLGVLTICTYGCWYYAFGVLLDPIIADTGWRESTLAASFSTGTVLVGLTSLAGGRMLDKAGHRRVFALGGTLTAAGLVSASFAQSITVFFVAAAIGLGATGALGFYHVTMPTAVRLNGDNGPRAITVLTVWGAFASAIFLPVTAFMVERLEWRVTVRILAACGAGAFFAAALLLPPTSAGNRAAPPPLSVVIANIVGRRDAQLFTAAIGFGGIAMSTMLVYQVPTMTMLGLGAGTAATIAAFRGFCQLLGRLPLTPIVSRLGIDRALIVAFGAICVAGLLLAVSSTLAVGVIFAIVAGFGIGAFSPLQGMKSEQLFSRETLGATMGFYGAVMLLAGSVGPVLAGVVVESTGNRRWAGAIVTIAALAALMSVIALARTSRTSVDSGP